MTEEEIAALQDQLTEAQAEIDRLQTTTADREARAAHLTDSLAEAQAQLAAQAEALATAQAKAEGLRASLQAAAAKYRDARLASHPDVPPELVAGETVEEVDRQMEAALQVVAQLKTRLESLRLAERVPTGAPARRPPDLSALSPTEKIAYGLRTRE